MDEMTEEDARLDGFDSLDAFEAELKSIYPEGPGNGKSLYRVRFTILPPEEQERIKAEKARQKASGQGKTPAKP